VKSRMTCAPWPALLESLLPEDDTSTLVLCALALTVAGSRGSSALKESASDWLATTASAEGDQGAVGAGSSIHSVARNQIVGWGYFRFCIDSSYSSLCFKS
jgi:hypothetical protein